MTGSGLKALYYVVTTPAHQFWYMSSPQRKQRGATRTRKARDTTTKNKAHHLWHNPLQRGNMTPDCDTGKKGQPWRAYQRP